MPTFCRHNRFIERCPVCSPRSVRPGGASATQSTVSSAAPGATRPRSGAARPSSAARAAGLRVRRETRAEDDGFRSPLVPGLRSSADAERLAEEISFAAGRLLVLAGDPPGVYGDIRAAGDVEQASWLAFLCAYLCPVEGPDPFAGIRAATTDWATGELPDLSGVPLGPRTSHDEARGSETLLAYRAWAARAGSQQRALSGEEAWTAERRFERVYERLALPGFGRVGRFDLLVTLGRLGVYELRADSLHLVGDDGTTLAAKRVFGIGDRMHLEPRARALAEAARVPLEALDLALANWAAPERMTLGVAPETADEAARDQARDALGL